MKLSAEVKGLFFDRKSVTSAMDKATARGLSRAGALVRIIAIRSIKRTKRKISRPGEQPKSHEPKGKRPSMKEIYFHFDPANTDVIVGAIRYSTRANADTPASVPSILEHGGQSGIYERRRKGGTWGQASRRSALRPYQEERVRMVTIAARPFMVPALKVALPRINQFLEKSIKR